MVIFILECISTENNVVYNKMPKEGDNFRAVTSKEVFYFSKDGKYNYTSDECYFSHGNPPYSAGYRDGGIMLVTPQIADKIQFKGSMCTEQKPSTIEDKKLSFFDKYATTSFFLGHFSGISHVLFYLVLAFSTTYHFSNKKHNYILTFTLCFVGGGLLEVIQHFFVVGRSGSIEDQVLNSIGILLGMSLFWVVTKYNFLKEK